MRRNKKTLLKTFLVIAFSLLVVSCSGNEKKKNPSMQQIQKKEGFPVTVKKIQPQKFTRYLSFIGKFKGIKQTIVGAMVGGRIEKIYFKPGQKVKKDEVVISFPEDEPGSKIQQAKAAYNVSAKNYRRIKALFKAGEVSRAQLDGAEAKFIVDKSNYETVKQMIHLKAPYDGVLTELMVREGDNVKAKTPLFTIAKLNKMNIRIWLNANERNEIKKGMTAIATVNGKSFTGRVSVISMSMDPVKQAFYADLTFDNKKGEILPGLTADVKIIVYENDNAIVISRNLIKNEGSRHYVYVAEGNLARKIYVGLGHNNGIYYEINSGLKPGMSLIVTGNARISDGSKIKAVR